MSDFLGGPFFNRNLLAGGTVQINRGCWGGDIERQLVSSGQHRRRIRADLVGDIPIGRCTVGTHNDTINRALLHEMADHIVGNQGGGNPLADEFPGG